MMVGPTDPALLPGGLTGFDRLLEHRSRLAICVLLTREKSINFARLKYLLEESDGNLGAHLRRLEAAGYIAVTKSFIDRKPESRYALTAEGRRRLAAHLDALNVLITAGRPANN